MKLSTIHLLPPYYEYVIITMLRKASGHVTIHNVIGHVTIPNTVVT